MKEREGEREKERRKMRDEAEMRGVLRQESHEGRNVLIDVLLLPSTQLKKDYRPFFSWNA